MCIIFCKSELVKLAEIPSGSEYKLTVNGRILKNEQLGSQPDEQSVACEEDSGDNTRDDKDSQNNDMEPTGEVQPSNVKECTQSDDLMGTEESKSQANLDPTLQYSEQLKASNPVLSEETAKDLGILAHSLIICLRICSKAMETVGDWQKKRKETHELNDCKS